MPMAAGETKKMRTFQDRKISNPIQKIALVSDIHANLPALEAVYRHAIQHGVQLFLNAGDTVGFGPFPNECLDFIRLKKMVSVKGDYDQKVLEYPKRKNSLEKKKNPLQLFSFKWAYEQLTEHNFRFLADLPEFQCIPIGMKKVYIAHGSPMSIKAHLGSTTTHSELVANQKIAQSDFIICGNSHVYWSSQVKDTLFTNPGSVGRQDDGDPRASYATLSLSDPIKVDHYRVPYDISRVLQAIEVYNLPVEFSYMFQRGVNLERAIAELSNAKNDQTSTA